MTTPTETEMNLAKAIQRHVAILPDELQRETLDFVEYLEQRYGVASALDIKNVPSFDTEQWLARAWGSCPDFPDRVPQLPLDDIEVI